MKTWLSEDPGVPVADNQSAATAPDEAPSSEPSNGQEAASALSTASPLPATPTQDAHGGRSACRCASCAGGRDY